MAIFQNYSVSSSLLKVRRAAIFYRGCVFHNANQQFQCTKASTTNQMLFVNRIKPLIFQQLIISFLSLCIYYTVYL